MVFYISFTIKYKTANIPINIFIKTKNTKIAAAV